jgi:glycopeptide antibiotics resistance protein
LVSKYAFPDRLFWQLAAFGLLISGCLELGQLLFLHDRFASLSDVTMNTAGALIGVLLAKLRHKRSTT